MEHIGKILDRVYTELQTKSDKNKELNHEILSLETAQKLADYEKLKKRIKNMIKKAKIKDDLIYEGKAEMQNKFDTQIMELQHQIQSYKGKEDKLRELVKSNERQMIIHSTETTVCSINGWDVLKIIEGDDKE